MASAEEEDIDEYVDEVMDELDNISGDDDDDDDENSDDAIDGLEEVGALTEVGARTARRLRGKRRVLYLKRAIRKRKAMKRRRIGAGLPSPPFARSKRETERRAPLGFLESGSGQFFFTVPAGAGQSSTMTAKVSREAHADRLLIVPSAPGLVMQSVKVGDEEQLLAAGAPVELYSAPALTDTVPDNFSPLGPALDFVVVLVNTTAGEITGTIGIKASVKR